MNRIRRNVKRDIDNTPAGYGRLANEIVLAAIQDWKSLDSGVPETARCNYGELEKFFRSSYCEMLLHGTGLNGVWIVEQLKRERDNNA